jgi:ActR/RegA family two-component response regulator
VNMRSAVRILVLDDEQKWLDAVRLILGSEYDLSCTISPMRALRLLRTYEFSLAIVDQRLRGSGRPIDGLEFLAEKMRPLAPDLRAIILTGYANLDLAVKNLRAGAIVDYISKWSTDLPFKLKESVRSSTNGKNTNTVPIVQVFLSYERKDIRRVSNFRRKLLENGFTPWMDSEDLLPGTQWKSKIRKKMSEVDFVVAFLSPNSINKTGAVWGEFNLALDMQKDRPTDTIFLIPARLAQCDIPDPFKEYNVVDLFRETGFSKLLRALKSKDASGR